MTVILKVKQWFFVPYWWHAVIVAFILLAVCDVLDLPRRAYWLAFIAWMVGKEMGSLQARENTKVGGGIHDD